MPRKKRKDPMPIVLIALGGVMLLLAAFALLRQQSQASATAPTATAVQPEEFGYPDIQRVTLDEARSAFDQGQAVFVDVRGPASFEAGHIPGSLLIPVNQFETRWNELDPQDWIILYCT